MDGRSPKEVGRSTLNVGTKSTNVETVEEDLCNVSGYFVTKEEKEQRETKISANTYGDSLQNQAGPNNVQKKHMVNAHNSVETKDNLDTMDFEEVDIDQDIAKRNSRP